MRIARKNTLALCIGLIAVLAVSIAVGTLIYFQNQEPKAEIYTVTGTLSYAPGNAIYPGISASTINPNVSPQPSTRTFNPDPFGAGINETVSSFIFLDFSDKFTFPPNSGNAKYGYINYPSGFEQNDFVKISGPMSYSTLYLGYLMNVTSITHQAS
jgi:hypothetical protein